MKYLIVCIILFFNVSIFANENEFIDVTMLGVKGDGKTNNTKLLNKILKNDIKLYFPNGNYLIDSWVICHDNVEITGENMIKTKLISTSNVNSHTVILDGKNIKFSSITINGGGNKMNKPSQGDGASCLNITRTSSNILLNSLNFENAYNKQVIVLGSDVLIKSCNFKGNMNTKQNIDGIHLYGGTKKVSSIKIIKCKFTNMIRAGIYSDVLVENVQIIECEFDSSTNYDYAGATGIIIQGGGANFSISTNQFRNLNRGITLRNGSSDILIENNDFKNIYANAVMIFVSDDIHNKVSTEKAFVNTKSIQFLKRKPSYTLSFHNIYIKNNTASFSKFKNRIIESNTSSFLLVTSNSKHSVLYQDILVSRCKFISSPFTLKGFLFLNIKENDELNNLSFENNIYKGKAIFYNKSSKKRVKNN